MSNLNSIFSAMKKSNSIVAKPLDLYLASLSDSDSDRAINVNAPSSIGGCMRARYYSRTGVKKDSGSIPPRTRRIFDNGTHVHLRIQEYLKDAGVLLMDEVPVYNEATNIQGHTDGILKVSNVENAVLEIKSINDNGFKELKDAQEEHKQQALTYLYCLEERRKYLKETFNTLEVMEEDNNMYSLFQEYEKRFQHLIGGRKHTREQKIEYQCDLCWERDKILIQTDLPVIKCAIVYENKNDQNIKEFIITTTPANREIIGEVIQECLTLNEYVEYNKVPDGISDNPSDPACKWCDYKDTCGGEKK